MKNEKWLEEFSQFARAEEAVPEDLSLKLQSRMEPLLSPTGLSVFAKILGIHVATGLLSLAMCNQFGLNPFQSTITLDRWLMEVGGHSFCMLVCGFFYLSSSFLAAQWVMTMEELKTLKRNGFLQTLTLSLGSLALFYFFGAELVLAMAGLWLLGALVAGLLTVEISWRFRTVKA